MAKKAATTGPKPLTKSEIYNELAEKTGLSKKDVGGVFDALTGLIADNLGKKGPGAVTIPGLMKIIVQRKPAQKSRQVRNPATGEMVMSKPKPARNVVKVRPLKGLKDMV